MKLSHFEQAIWHEWRSARIQPQFCQQVVQLKSVVEAIAVLRKIAR